MNSPLINAYFREIRHDVPAVIALCCRHTREANVMFTTVPVAENKHVYEQRITGPMLRSAMSLAHLLEMLHESEEVYMDVVCE